MAVVAHGQAIVDEQKVDAFAHAIASAEGFGVKHTIPTRYHNPGDIRADRSVRYPDQVGLRKGYVVFKNDEAGFAALKTQLRKIVNGESRHYNPDMTIEKVAKVYAGNWRRWSKNVCRQLQVPPSTTLRAYLAMKFPDLVPFNPAVPVLETAN
jgi:hypothetical protein